MEYSSFESAIKEVSAKRNSWIIEKLSDKAENDFNKIVNKTTIKYFVKNDVMFLWLILPRTYHTKTLDLYLYILKTIFNKHGLFLSIEKKQLYEAKVIIKEIGTIVNGEKQLFDSTAQILTYKIKERIKKYTSICHYTCLKNAINILNTNSFYCFPLAKYNHEKKFSKDENTNKICFIVSFTSINNNNPKLWDKFADNGKGCKIDYYFKENFFDATVSRAAIDCYDNKGNIDKRYVLFEHSPFTNIGDVFFRKLYLKPRVYKYYKNNANIFIDQNNSSEPYIIIDDIANSLIERVKEFNEIRIAFLLTSTEEVILTNMYNKIVFPFKEDKIERIVVTFGNKVTQNEKKEFKNAIKSKININYINRDN